MKHAGTAARIILGLLFLVFGLNGFFNFLPAPTPPEAAAKFLGGLASSGYFFPFLKGTEVLMGALLLSNLFVPLALIILAPVLLNIFLYHFFLAPEGLLLPVVLVALALFLGHAYRGTFKAILKPRN